MNAPKKGYYKTLLQESFPDVIIVYYDAEYTDGLSKIDSTGILGVLDSYDDDGAMFYAEQIRSGRMLTMMPKVN